LKLQKNGPSKVRTNGNSQGGIRPGGMGGPTIILIV
jgi:hypothetical protein